MAGRRADEPPYSHKPYRQKSNFIARSGFYFPCSAVTISEKSAIVENSDSSPASKRQSVLADLLIVGVYHHFVKKSIDRRPQRGDLLQRLPVLACSSCAAPPPSSPRRPSRVVRVRPLP